MTTIGGIKLTEAGETVFTAWTKIMAARDSANRARSPRQHRRVIAMLDEAADYLENALASNEPSITRRDLASALARLAASEGDKR